MSDTVSLKDVEELNSKLSEATDQITALSERVTAAETRADSAEAKFAATEKELADERLAAALKQARSEGRIDAKDETTAKFTDLHEKVGLDGVRSLLSMIPAETIPLSATGHGGDKPLELSDAPEGVDPASHKIHLRAEEIASEKDIPYEQAASIAFQEAQV